MGAEIGAKPLENPAYFQSSVAWVRTSIPAWNGSSGGPFLTESGDVFGMVIKSDYLNSWGTMSNHISFLIDRMRGKVAEKGWIEFAGNASLQPDNTLLIEEVSSRLRGN